MSAVAQMDATSRCRRPAAEAAAVAQDFIDAIGDICETICVAGSLRRRKSFVKDVEIVFVPRLIPDPNYVPVRADLFAAPKPAPFVSEVDLMLEKLLVTGLIQKRPNVNGNFAWGYKNKLAIHSPSGMAVDLFTASRSNFFNYLVCRTGGEQNNIEVASAAQRKGWKWNPYGNGFSRQVGLSIEYHDVTSEREVFEFVGMPYKEPWERS